MNNQRRIRKKEGINNKPKINAQKILLLNDVRNLFKIHDLDVTDDINERLVQKIANIVYNRMVDVAEEGKNNG